MIDGLGSLGGNSFLGRRHSAGNGIRSLPITTSQLPPPAPDHNCREFRAPEGTYSLVHQVFQHDLQPSFTVGTTASLASADYQPITITTTTASSSTSNSNHNHHHQSPSSENDHSRTPSLSSSSSSANNKSNSGSGNGNHTADSNKHSNDVPPSSSLSTSPQPHSSITFSFLNRKTSSRLSRAHTTGVKKNAHHSSFVSRIVTHSQFSKVLRARNDAENSTDLFFNCGHSFIWADTLGHPEDPLLRIAFAKAYPTSHDVNLFTKTHDHVDTIIGFNTGDIICLDPYSQKFCRINKGGILNASPVTAIRWLHGSGSLFMAAFADGTMMVLDKNKEDAPFHPENNVLNLRSTSGEPQNFAFHVSKPIPRVSTKNNPVSHWKISTKTITAFAFSPDDQHVAVVGSDGLLRVINFVHETLYDIYQAYYGGLTCVAWSPDGRYILTGGEDDLVTIWAFREQRIVARCQGHSSWVTGVAFDPWHCDDQNGYRFASVGEDAKLILWDFSVHAIHRPKTRSNTVSSGNGGNSTTGGRHRGASVSSQHVVPAPPGSSLLGATAAATAKAPTLHALQAKTHVAFLQPTVVKAIHADPCAAVYFRKDVIITTDKRGRICMWRRPRPSPTRH